jgi:DNA repair protein RadC
MESGGLECLVGTLVRGPEDLGDTLVMSFHSRREGVLIRLQMDEGQRITQANATGLGPGCSLSPRGNLLRAVAQTPRAILVAHSHPGRSTRPSSNDLEWTRLLICEAKEWGTELLDHFVVSKWTWRSLRESTKLWDGDASPHPQTGPSPRPAP